jgi:hypothetical protein
MGRNPGITSPLQQIRVFVVNCLQKFRTDCVPLSLFSTDDENHDTNDPKGVTAAQTGETQGQKWGLFVALRVELKKAKIMVLNYFFSIDRGLQPPHRPYIKP